MHILDTNICQYRYGECFLSVTIMRCHNFEVNLEHSRIISIFFILSNNLLIIFHYGIIIGTIKLLLYKSLLVLSDTTTKISSKTKSQGLA